MKQTEQLSFTRTVKAHGKAGLGTARNGSTGRVNSLPEVRPKDSLRHENIWRYSLGPCLINKTLNKWQSHCYTLTRINLGRGEDVAGVAFACFDTHRSGIRPWFRYLPLRPAMAPRPFSYEQKCRTSEATLGQDPGRRTPTTGGNSARRQIHHNPDIHRR